MRNFLTVAALAALLALTSARKLPLTHLHDPTRHINATHFVDPSTNKTYKHFDCDVTAKKGTKAFNKTVHGLHAKHKAHAHGSRIPQALVRKQVQTPININAYYHVVETTARAGTYTQEMATAQAAALNAAYNPIGVTFTLVNTSFTANDAWAVADGADMDALKAALRQGTYKDLNLYLHSDLTGGILGTCTLPSEVPAGADSSVYISDGCNVAAGTMPGGDIGGYNAGGTSVHEVGHWLGLLHTFEGYSCDGDGDSIVDTPVQSEATSGCPTDPVKDSCPGQEGVDAIHNYMDYSTDACYSEFSPGQVARVAALWTQYRAGN